MGEELRCPERSACPLNAFLEPLGDKWTLLIVRDLLFKGKTRYGEFLDGGEGVATNILADRLQRLEAGGIVESRSDDADARKRLYRLTAKGLDLAPALVEMVLWGAKYYRTAAPPDVIRRMTRDRAGFLRELRRAHDAPKAGARADMTRPKEER